MTTLWAGRRVVVTGASGFLGRAVTRILSETGCELALPTRYDYDLLDQASVRGMFTDLRPEIVVHLAGLVGGIWANRERPAEFCYENLLMNTLVFHEAWAAGVDKYVTCIGGCSYPHDAPSPIPEAALWNGYPQPESAPYSLAKRMNVVLSEAYRRQHGFNSIVLVPGNLYGPHDNFSLTNAHVIPALIRKMYEATRSGAAEVVVWGSGAAIRDFVYVDDVGRALVHATETYDRSEIINISSGQETTIAQLVATIARLVRFEGRIVWDRTKPDGQMRKGFDVTRMQTVLGLKPETPLEDGLRRTIDWFVGNYSEARM